MTEFEILARSLRPRLIKTARKYVGDDDAEDVVQDTMLKLWNLRDTLGEYRSVEALAVLVVKRRSLNLLRDKGAVPRAALEECADDVPSGEDILIGRQKAEYVDGILASLPDSMQTLIRLRHIEGYDNAAIAAITGSSEGAVRTALSRARRKVATLFNINEIN